MKIIYVSDLHGSRNGFFKIYQLAKSLNVDVVINGGDMLPTFGGLLNQDKFIINYLDEYFSKFNEAKIYHLSYLGNDDLMIFDDLFEKTCDKYSYIVPLSPKKIEIEDYEFIGMNWVVDYPFALKDRCRKDTKDYTFQKQFGKAVLSSPEGWKYIDNWFSYAAKIPTIEDEINQLIRPINMANTIYVIHMPPKNLGLDVCSDGSKVGSMAIYDFIKKHQPLLTLHGHIHESPEISGKWYSILGNTVCIQPGQSTHHENSLTYVTIDLKTMKFDRFLVKTNE